MIGRKILPASAAEVSFCIAAHPYYNNQTTLKPLSNEFRLNILFGGSTTPMPTTGDTMPAHVAMIFSDYIRLHGNIGQLWQRLREAGHGDRLFTDEFGYSAISFEAGVPHAKNISLLTLLFLLNDSGFPLAEDHTQLCSPAEFMRELQSGLVLRTSFRSVGARHQDPKDWIYRVHEPVA
jgi:hypothetical protein